MYLGAGVRLNTLRGSSMVPLAYEPATNPADGSGNVAAFDGHAQVVPAANRPALLARVRAAALDLDPASDREVEGRRSGSDDR